MSDSLKYKRVLLKLSGEGLMGSGDFGIDPETVKRTALEVKAVHDMGVQVALVIGGGNIFRGISGVASGFERTSADYMGMLATVMNALAVRNTLEQVGVPARVQSGIRMPQVCEPFVRGKAIRHLEKGRVVIFAAGTGSPYFTTDTGAALRAVETNCDALLKGTQVDGVYDADPKKVPDAKRYDRLSFKQVLAQDLRVMDSTAIALARENDVPILVFSMHEDGGFSKVVKGEGKFTIIDGGSE